MMSASVRAAALEGLTSDQLLNISWKVEKTGFGVGLDVDYENQRHPRGLQELGLNSGTTEPPPSAIR